MGLYWICKLLLIVWPFWWYEFYQSTNVKDVSIFWHLLFFCLRFYNSHGRDASHPMLNLFKDFKKFLQVLWLEWIVQVLSQPWNCLYTQRILILGVDFMSCNYKLFCEFQSYLRSLWVSLCKGLCHLQTKVDWPPLFQFVSILFAFFPLKALVRTFRTIFNSSDESRHPIGLQILLEISEFFSYSI